MSSRVPPEDVTGGGESRARSDGGPVQSVDRAVTILELLARHDELGVTDLAAELGVHKSTVSRLVAALEGRGLVEQAGPRGKYRLGYGLVRLAGARMVGDDLVQQSQPVCEDLAAQVGETVNVAVAAEGAALNVAQVLGSSAVVTANWVGRRTPLHATSSGKVLLAHLDEATLREVLRGPLERYTPQTVAGVRKLRKELLDIRAQGFATAAGELELGLNAVSAPIRDVSGRVVAAVSVSGPSYRLAEDELTRVTALVVEAGAEVSHRLGYLDED